MTTNCLQIVANLNKKHGGPTISVTSLCDHLAANGLNVTLASQSSATENVEDLILPNKLTSSSIFPAFNLLGTLFTANYERKLAKLIRSQHINIIHSHGLWLQCNKQAASISSAHNIPHVISPRGMLEPWALKHHFWKKYPSWHLWQLHSLQSCSLLVATSKQEAENFRILGLRNPIAIIPNGVKLPEFDTNIKVNTSNSKTILFLSRIHPKKGLENLIIAWDKVRPNGWNCTIAGPDEGDHESYIKKLVNDLSLHNSFKFIGPVYGDDKKQLLQSADLFVLPTHSENFGIAVAEALSYGIPVITTKGAPWESLITNNCGWWIDIGSHALETALREACSTSSETLQEMGNNGRNLMANEYSWDSAASSMANAYEWVLNGGTPPDCVRID